MNEITLNDELTLTCPDGFREMEGDELKAVFPEEPMGCWAACDDERHIIIAAQWHDSGRKLLAKMVSAKDQLGRIDSARRKSFKSYGYQSGKPYETEVAGEGAWRQDCSYQIKGIDHVASSVVLKSGSCFYTLYLYGRAAQEAESRAAFDQVLSSLRLA